MVKEGAPSLETSHPRVVVTLVHGTFAPDAAWTHEDSALRGVLRRTLPAESIVERFMWSGENGYADRAAAAGRLNRRLRRNLQEYPHARHILVCHSHGGTVASYAFARKPQPKPITGVALMASPIISTRPNRGLSGNNVAVVLWLASMAVVAYAVFGFFESFRNSTLWFMVGEIVVFVGGTLILGIVAQLLVPLARRIAHRRQSLSRATRCADAQALAPAVLVARSRADEALALLRALRTPEALVNLLVAAVFACVAIGLGAAYAYLVIVHFVQALWPLRPELISYFKGLLMLPAVVGILWAGASVIGRMVAPLFSLLTGGLYSHGLGWGSVSPTDHLALTFRVRDRPGGDQGGVTFRLYPLSSGRRGLRMRHSLYEDERFLADFERWLGVLAEGEGTEQIDRMKGLFAAS